MIDARDNPSNTERPKTISEFQKRITNGGIIQLGVKTHNGEDIEMISRWGQSPIEPTKTPATVELFTRKGNIVKPVGLKDWLITAEDAWATGLYPGDIPVSDVIEEAFNKVRMEHGVHTLWVEEAFRRQGGGSFLVAASLALLDKLNVKNILMFGLTEAGERTWGRFGVEGTSTRSLSDLIQHPATASSIHEFLHPKT